MRTKQESIEINSIVVITNTYISDKRTINMVSKLKVIESAQDDYRNKRKFAIAHNGSTVKQEALKRQILLNTSNDDILLINSETMSDDNVKEALKNPNFNFAKYAGIIYSPSVQSGLSYDVKDTIHSIYGIFGNCSNSSNDICQMLHRSRHPISNEVMVSVEMFNFGVPKPTTSDAMMRSLKTSRSHIYSQANIALWYANYVYQLHYTSLIQPYQKHPNHHFL